LGEELGRAKQLDLSMRYEADTVAQSTRRLHVLRSYQNDAVVFVAMNDFLNETFLSRIHPLHRVVKQN
jgi:hypothetical protein